MNLLVANLDEDVTDEDLEELFGVYGDLTSAKVFINFKTRRSRGFGLVEMKHDEDAIYAMAELNGKLWHGKYLEVSIARKQR